MSTAPLRHLAQQAAIIGMEASCFAALIFLFGVGDGQVPLAAFVLVGWGMLAFNRWLFGLALWDSVQGKAISIAVALFGISLLMGITSPEIGLFAGPVTFLRSLSDLPRFFSGAAPSTAAMLGGLMLYYRVILVVREPVGVMGIARRVVSALAIFIWVTFVMDVQRGGIAWEVGIVFAAFVLVSIILTRTHELDLIPGVHPVPATPGWAGLITGIIAATLAVGLFLQTFSVEPLKRIGALLQPLWSALIILLAYPLRLLLMLLEPFIQLIVGELDPQPLTRPPMEGVETQPEPLQVAQSVWMGEWLPLLAWVGAIIVVLVIFNQAYRRFRQRPMSNSVAKSDYEKGERGQWFPFRLRNPFARRADYGTETVRDLYKNVLVFGENQGLSRAEDDTPYEYLEPLVEKYPAVSAEFRALTEAYVASHYGEIKFTRDEINRLQAAWRRIKQHSSV